MTRIALTGASGFLGSRLLVELQDRGHDCYNWDRVNGVDIGENWSADDLLDSVKPEVVVHLAGAPGRLFCEDDPAMAFHLNSTVTALLARACGRRNVRLAYVSTSEVYGPQDQQPATELFPPRPINTYALSKYFGEQAAKLYAPDGLVILRPTMPYGPGMLTGYGRAMLPTLIANALNRQPSMVHLGSARSWCYVDDTIRGMADVVERGTGVYNVGRDDDLIETENLARLVYETLGASLSLLEFSEPDRTVTRVKNLSCRRLGDLGWEPRVSLAEGIERTAEALREGLATT